jgi:hypothetical protein
MASNAPRVFREQTTFQNQKIGVARVYDGGQTGRAIVSGANRIAATAFQFAAEDAQEIGADEGKSRTVQDIITINPETGEPQAVSGMKGLGRIASRAYNRVIETRFKQHIGEELMNRGKVLAAQFPTDPDGYAETYGDYIAQMAGNAKGKWGEFIREAGTSYLNRTRATIMANGIRAANARYARGVQTSTEQGNTALQDLTREVGPAAFLPTLGNLSVEEGGPGADDLQIGKFLGPTSSAFLQPDGSVQRIVTETPERLSFGDSFAPEARDPAYAVSDAQQQVTTYAPNTMFDQPIPRSPFPDYVSGILFEGGPEVAPIPPQANLGTLAGQIARSVTTGYLDAYYAGIVNEETVRQFDSAQRANIVIGLTGHAFKGIDLTDPDMKPWLNQVGLAVETQRWDLLGKLIPGVKPFLSHPFKGSDLKLMGQVIEADIVNLKTVISDNVAEMELRAKAADAAILKRISLLGYPAAMFGDAAEGVVEDMIRFSGSPEEYSRTVSSLLTLESGLLSNLWADIQGEDDANLFKAKLDGFRGMLVSVAARPIETLVAHGKLTSEQRETLLVQLDRLNRGFPADLREVPPEIASLLGSVMKLKSYDPEIGTKVYDQVKDFIDSEEKVLARQEELESAQAADQLATIFAQSLRENANAGFLGPGEAVERLATLQLDLESLPNLKATKFNSALQSAYREAARIDIGYFAERMSSVAEFDAFSSYLKTGNKDQLSAISEAYRADVQAMRETLVVKSAIGDSVSALSAVLMDQRASLEAVLERNAVDAEQKASTDRVNSGYADYANPRDMEVLGSKIAAAVASIPSAGFYGKSLSEADYVGPMMDNESVRLAVAREIVKGGAMPTELMNVLQRIASGWVPMPSASSDMTRAIDLFSDIYTSTSGRMAITGQFRASKDLETLADLNMYALARTWMEPERFHEFAAKMTGMRGLTTDIEDQAKAVFGKSPEAWIRGEFGTEYEGMFGDERKALVRLATILGGSAGASSAMVRSEIESFSNNFYQPDPAHFLFYSSDSMGAFRNKIKVPLLSAFSLPAQDGPVEEKEIINAVKGYLTEMADKHDINARFAMRGYEVRNSTTGMPVSYNLFEGVFGEGAELFSLVERGWQRGPDGRSYMTYEIFTVDRDGNMNPVMVDGKRQSLSGAEPYFQMLFAKKRLEHEQAARDAERAAADQTERERLAREIDENWDMPN